MANGKKGGSNLEALTNKEYDFTAPWKTIERDIRQFYRTGKEPSITQQFHR